MRTLHKHHIRTSCACADVSALLARFIPVLSRLRRGDTGRHDPGPAPRDPRTGNGLPRCPQPALRDAFPASQAVLAALALRRQPALPPALPAACCAHARGLRGGAASSGSPPLAGSSGAFGLLQGFPHGAGSPGVREGAEPAREPWGHACVPCLRSVNGVGSLRLWSAAGRHWSFRVPQSVVSGCQYTQRRRAPVFPSTHMEKYRCLSIT